MVFVVELEAMFIAKSLVLSDEDEITSVPFIMADTDGLPLVRIAFAILQNSRDPSSLFPTLARGAPCSWSRVLENATFSRTLLHWLRPVLNEAKVLLHRFPEIDTDSYTAQQGQIVQ